METQRVSNGAESKEMEQTTMLDRKPTYSDLPVEIISCIFSYLSHTDCLQAGSTCKLWRDAFFESSHKRTGKVHFAGICLSDSTSPGTYLLKSHRSYRTFHFKGVTFGDSAELIAHIGQTAVNVTFDNVNISKEEFHLFRRHATNLESLTIKGCSDLFLSGLLMDDDVEEGDITSSFASIRHLSLPRNKHLRDAVFWRITSSIKMLESLDMSGCPITYHNAICKRFYPNANVPPSDLLLTFKMIANVIKTHRKHIKELNLSDTMVGHTDFQLLAPNEEELDCIKLYSLKFARCWELNTFGITSFLKTQPQLVVLDLAKTKCVDDDFLKMLVETLPMIEDLNISECRSVTNKGCAHLGTLKRLKRLNISFCNKIRTNGLRRGIARTVNTQLHHLEMCGLAICEEGIKCIALNCLELRQLDIGSCNNGVTDTSLKYILQHLRWLRDLSLKHCIHITDAGLTGINIPANESDTTATDAAYICEQFKNDINLTTNRVSIQSLKGLRRLNLAGCPITDATLVHSIKFAELTDLNLSGCEEISSRGIQSVALNCPSIERLDFCCYRIRDEDIFLLTYFIIKKVSLLKELRIDNSYHLRKHTLDAIRNLTSSTS